MFLTRKFKPELFFPPLSPSARPISSWCWFWFLGLKDGNRSGMNFLTGENGRMYLELRNDLTPEKLVTQVLGPSNLLAGHCLRVGKLFLAGWRHISNSGNFSLSRRLLLSAASVSCKLDPVKTSEPLGQPDGLCMTCCEGRSRGGGLIKTRLVQTLHASHLRSTNNQRKCLLDQYFYRTSHPSPAQ